MSTRTRTTVLDHPGDGVVTLSVLPGGLRVITESMPGANSASVGIWVGVGSLDETPRMSGASHFLEHLLFKGTSTRTGREIAIGMDAIGGELNAFTSHEYTCYYAHVLAARAQYAVEVVCDVVLDAVIAAGDVDVERQVILEEIAMRDDSPEDSVGDLFAEAVFAGDTLERSVIGTVETIEALTRKQIHGYYARTYDPTRMVVSVAGGIEHAEVLRWVRTAFRGHVTIGDEPSAPRLASPRSARPRGGLELIERDSEQVQVAIGMRSIGRTDPKRHALAIFSTAMGGGMSSRLFRAVREDRGLAYSCYASTAAYAATGSFGVYLGCQPDNLAEAIDVIAAEFDAVRDGLLPEELSRCKGQIIGSMILGLEDSESRMSRIGKNLLTRGKFHSVADDIDAVNAVSLEDVREVVQELLSRPVAAALVGPYAGEADLPAALLAMNRTGLGRSRR